jgi:glycosyltransferase involved in cell wall biosynthesis
MGSKALELPKKRCELTCELTLVARLTSSPAGMKRVTFVLSGPAVRPIGGNKIIFEYANRLAADGFEVHIAVAATILWKEQPLHLKLATAARYPFYLLSERTFSPRNWFPLDPRVILHGVPTLEEKYVPDADVVFATAAETASYVARYSEKKGKKFYLIQHFEDWHLNKERVLETWRLPLRRIVISKWLKKIANDEGLEADLVYYGFDFKVFGRDTPIEERDPNTLIMLYHTVGWKGIDVGLAAVAKVHKQNPKTRLILFGGFRAPPGLPSYVEFHFSPPQALLRKLYNRASILVGPSYGEGFGMIVPEAMQCGCAVVCTDIPGHEIAVQDEAALRSPPGNSDALADNVLRAIQDDALRYRLANRGHEMVQQFRWERAYTQFKLILENEMSGGPTRRIESISDGIGQATSS